MYKKDLALNNLQLLICHKNKPNQTKPNQTIQNQISISGIWLGRIVTYYAFAYVNAVKLQINLAKGRFLAQK